MEVTCLLDAAATHSCVHPYMVSLTSAVKSKNAKLTLMVANSSKAVFDNVVETGLVFMVQGEKKCQVTTAVKLYVLNGLLTNLILGMDFCNGINHRLVGLILVLLYLVWQQMDVYVNQALIV